MLSDTAYDAIKELILSTRLAPGARITEAQLAAQLQTGKTPVREALARLEREKLVAVSPRNGYRVTPLTVKDVRDLFALRTLLEREAVRLTGGKKLGEAQARRLEELCQLSRELDMADPQQLRLALRANTEFHLLLVAHSGNQWLISLLQGVLEQIERIMHVTIPAIPIEDMNPSEHVDLVRAMRSGDAEVVIGLMEAQESFWRDRMVDLLLSSEAVFSVVIGITALSEPSVPTTDSIPAAL